MTVPSFSVAVFPFLKTSGRVKIGEHTFRSTTDVADLPLEQAKAVTEIAQMLFAQGNFRVKTASYAIIPLLEINGPSTALDQLAYLRAVLAYIYASPHEIFGNVFLTPEDVSLVLFTPSLVSKFLVRPEHHTENISADTGPTPNAHHDVVGYRGLYNFRHYFWIEPNSRLYGPKPHATLNISQDLAIDLEQRIPQSYRLLLELLNKPVSSAALRIYSALHWFNAANEDAIDPDRALLNLGVAFEALLRLPEASKTERLVDAIALLLGRTERVDDWAKQFYDARSRVAHEGRLRDPYFYVPVNGQHKRQAGIFGSLMLYGRQIFQLCTSTLLVGMDLADRADLQEKFITNNERYQKICDLLKAEADTPNGRLLAIESIIRALERYRFVDTAVISRGPLVSAVCRAAMTLRECRQPLEQALADALAESTASKREDSELTQLAAIERLHTAFGGAELSNLTPEACVVRDLVEVAWMSVFQYYYWLKEHDQTAT